MSYTFKPFSKNIIFFDSEFSSLDPYKGEILSIGLVTRTGEELYLELEHTGPVDPWVVTNILPNLNGLIIGRSQAIKQIQKFVGKRKPYLVAYINQFDFIYIRKLFTSSDIPFHWIPIDFSSILFALGLDPKAYFPKDKKNFFKSIGIDASKYHQHNALDDAKLLREVYLKMAK